MNAVFSESERTPLKELCALAEERLASAKAYEDLLLEEAAEIFAKKAGALDVEERAELFADMIAEMRFPHPHLAAKACAEALNKRGKGGGPFPPAQRRSGAIAVCESRFISALKEKTQGSRLIFAENFEEACEMAGDGRVDGCFLPLYDGEGRLLSGIRRLCIGSGLKIGRLVELTDGEERAVYALFSEECADREDADCMEISFPKNAFFGENDPFPVFSANGLKCSLTEDGRRSVLTARGERETLYRALDAALLICPDGTVEGFYASSAENG